MCAHTSTHTHMHIKQKKIKKLQRTCVVLQIRAWVAVVGKVLSSLLRAHSKCLGAKCHSVYSWFSAGLSKTGVGGTQSRNFKPEGPSRKWEPEI